MSVEVLIGSSNDWGFLKPDSPARHDEIVVSEALSPIERRTLLAEQLRCLSQELSIARDHYNLCICRRIAASALGHVIDDSEFRLAQANLNRLAPERLACMVAIRDTNEILHLQGADTHELAAHLTRISYHNPALADHEDNIFGTPSDPLS